ncbi:MAG: heme exporter protein CcmB [Gammaproteobacteria bacterium]
MKPYYFLIRQDLRLALRFKADWINSWLFYILVVSLFPLVLPVDPSLLHKIGPGLIWIAAVLSILLSMNGFLRPDFREGSLAQLVLSPLSLTGLMLAKMLAQWLISFIPLLCITPVLAFSLQLSGQETLILLCTLALGTPTLSFLSAVAAALTVNIRNHTSLLSLMILPLGVPVLIFATGAVMDVAAGVSSKGALAWLGALLAITLSLTPFAVSASVRWLHD